MKNRRPCGTGSGCCRNCPYLINKPAINAGSSPGVCVDPLTIPVMAEATLAEEPKTAIVPEQPPESTDTNASESALADFLEQHPKQGKLRVQAFRGPQALPVEGVHVTISRDFDGEPYVFFEGDTDMSGIIDQIALPAAARDASLKPGLPQPVAAYRLLVEHPAYVPLDTTVDIYENIKTTQLVQLALKEEG